MLTSPAVRKILRPRSVSGYSSAHSDNGSRFSKKYSSAKLDIERGYS